MDYYDTLITGKKQGRKVNYNKAQIESLINEGLSSIKISKKIGVSYPSVLTYVRKNIPKLESLLLCNGKKAKIRRKYLLDLF